MIEEPKYVITVEQQHHKIYLAGSWKNSQEILLVRDILKSQGHEVDCFASTDTGRTSFSWLELTKGLGCITQADAEKKLSQMDAIDLLKFDRVVEAFNEDRKWLDWCDMCILTLPSGKSAHLEVGYAKGRGKIVVIFGEFLKGDRDVMYGFADALFRCDEIDHMVDFVNEVRSHPLTTELAQERERVLDAILENLKERSMIGGALEIIEEERGKGWLREQILKSLRSTGKKEERK